MSYPLPPEPRNRDHKLRKVGLELEFAGLSIEKVAQLIVRLYGGTLRRAHRYQATVEGTELGDFRVELDARILRKMARQDLFDTGGIDLQGGSFRKSLEEIVDKLAMSVVPVEIVMPPVELDQLHRLEALRQALHENKAEGTGTSVVHAFGMHMNIESPDLESATLLRYIKAFLVVYPWLVSRLKIDFSRRISPFVDPFSDNYVRSVLQPDYQPDTATLISDYVDFNPTRNRPLDMMPLFGMLKPGLIQPVMEGEKNDPRPTFHYRLPNSRVDDPGWSFEDEWRLWMAVEQLAADPDMLDKLSRLYLVRDRDTVISFRKEWAQTVQILLDPDA